MWLQCLHLPIMDHLVVVTTTHQARRPCLARIIMAASLFGVFRSVSVALPLDALASCELRGAGPLLLLASRLPETLRLQFALCLSDRCGGTVGLQGDYFF